MARLIREAAPLSSGHGRAESPRLHRTVAAANLEPVDGIAFADLAEQNVTLKSMVSADEGSHLHLIVIVARVLADALVSFELGAGLLHR